MFIKLMKKAFFLEIFSSLILKEALNFAKEKLQNFKKANNKLIPNFYKQFNILTNNGG